MLLQNLGVYRDVAIVTSKRCVGPSFPVRLRDRRRMGRTGS
jgi:hypothetical protein